VAKYRPDWLANLLVGAVAAAMFTACAADDGAEEPEDESVVESDATGCLVAQAGSGFGNQTFSQQTGTFSADFTATPSAAPIDAVMGLSSGASADYTRLAAIVRFNPSGTIDVRAGGTYRSDTTVRYVAGQPYRFHFDVNVRSHVYSVSLLQGSSTIRLATNYPFRTEQASVTALNNLATAVASSSGFVQACGFTVAPVLLPCKTATAGATFTNTTLTRSSGVLTLELNATPSAANVDSVMGVSLGAATSYSSLAASVRFSPAGKIEARDGDTYRSDFELTYAAGTTYRFRFVVDVARHQYSVWVKRPSDPYPLDVGIRYKFRPTQSSVTAVDNLATIVASSTGTLRTCNAQSRASSKVAYAIDLVNDRALPLPNNELLVRDNTNINGANDRTLRLSATGQPLASIPLGGTAATDAAGNVYIARGEYPGLTLHAYSSSYAPRWTRSLALSDFAFVHSIATDAAGNIMVAMTRGYSPYIVMSIHGFAPDGTHRWSIYPSNAANIAFTSDGFVLAFIYDGWAVIQRQTSSQIIWQHPISWARPGRLTVDAISVDSSGRVFFVGSYGQATNFSSTQGVPLLPYQPGAYDTNTYAVGLGADGRYLFQRRLGITNAYSVSSNATRTAVSGTNRIGVSLPALLQLDNSTGRVLTQTFDTSLGPYGEGGEVFINSTGRIFWTEYTQWGPGQYAGKWLSSLTP
jgi:hypothetical protein